MNSFGDSIDDVEDLMRKHQDFVEGQMPVGYYGICSSSTIFGGDAL